MNSCVQSKPFAEFFPELIPSILLTRPIGHSLEDFWKQENLRAVLDGCLKNKLVDSAGDPSTETVIGGSQPMLEKNFVIGPG
jgi:hypothetical protein